VLFPCRYDGVEIMGSEGYFINQFIVKRTNKRTDAWGGEYKNRIKLPVEIVKVRSLSRTICVTLSWVILSV
jgi:2,4-dienoyl-CoA reductase-like NADH-dependent reductase (Old Yellow Enzyme family)